MSLSALGIDIGSHSVKAILLRRRGARLQVLRAGSATLEELGHMEDSRRKTTKVAIIVRNLLRASAIRPQPARTAVAGRKSIIRYTRVPPAPAWRLKMLVDYEIEGDSEGGAKDLAYDFCLLELPSAHLEFTVLMAMARNELVDSHCELLQEAGVRVDDITLSPFPIFNTFLHNRTASIEDDKNYLLLDIGSENLNVAVQRNGKLLFARNISPAGRAFTEAVQDEFRLPFAEAEALKCSKGRLLIGGDVSSDETQASPSADAPTEISIAAGTTPGTAGTAAGTTAGTAAGTTADSATPTSVTEDAPVRFAEDDLGPQLSPEDSDRVAQLSEAMLPVVGRLASAIQSSLMYCRAQTRLTDLEIDAMVVTGGGSRLPGLRQALSRRLGIPLAPADPLKGLDLSPLRREARENLEANPESFVTAIGLALSKLNPQAVNLSLLPEKLKLRRRFFAKTLYLWLAGAAMLALTVLIAYSSWRTTTGLKNHVSELEGALEQNNAAKGSMDTLLRVNSQYAQEVALMADCFLSPRELMAAFGALTRHVPPEVELTKFAAAPPRGGSDSAEVIIEGVVLARIQPRGGPERILQQSDAHAIIGKLRDDLTADPVFEPPPAPQSVIQRELFLPTPRTIAEFQLKVMFVRQKHGTALGTK